MGCQLYQRSANPRTDGAHRGPLPDNTSSAVRCAGIGLAQGGGAGQQRQLALVGAHILGDLVASSMSRMAGSWY